MATYRERRDPLRLMWRRLSAILLLVVVAIGVRAVWGVYQKSQESYVLRLEAEAQLKDLEGREAELRADIAALKTDRGIEALLRERYELGKDDEGVVVIVDQNPSPPAPKPTALEKVKHWFWW